jgi:hypothetical protein
MGKTLWVALIRPPRRLIYNDFVRGNTVFFLYSSSSLQRTAFFSRLEFCHDDETWQAIGKVFFCHDTVHIVGIG